MDAEIKNLFVAVIIASLATVGIVEVLKNFLKTEKKWVYSVIAVPLAVILYWVRYALPVWVIGAVLTVGATQLCYQTLVQTFHSLVTMLANVSKRPSDMGGSDSFEKSGKTESVGLLMFVKKYDGKKVDYDGRFGPQCVDLFRQYCKEVLCIPHTGGVEGAKDLWFQYSSLREKDFFVQISNDGLPEEGDVAVWGATDKNSFGHVAIVIKEWGDSLIVFEQDGLKKDGAKIKVRGKGNLLGYLRLM